MKNFYEKCYEVLRKIPKGKVTIYKYIAKSLHSKAYRAVGTAMNKNPSSFLDGEKSRVTELLIVMVRLESLHPELQKRLKCLKPKA